MLHEFNRVELLIPAHRRAVHFQPTLHHIGRSQQIQQSVTGLPDPKSCKQDAAISLSPSPSMMLVKITVTVSTNLNRKPHRETSDRLSPEVGDRSLGCKSDAKARAPYPQAQVDFFVLIEELLVKAAQLLEQTAAKHDTTARLPVHIPLRVAFPPFIFVVQNGILYVSEKSQAERRHQRPRNCVQKTRRPLVGSIRVVHAAAERPCLRMPVRKLDPAIQ